MDFRTKIIIKKISLRLSQIALVFMLVLLFYVLFQEEINIYSLTIRNPLYKYMDAVGWWLHVIVGLIIVSAFSAAIFGFLSFYYTFTNERKEKLQKYYNSIFTKYLIDYLFKENISDTEHIGFILKMKEITKKNIQFLSLFNVFTKIQENLAVDLSQKFISLIDELQIRNKMVKLIYSNDFSEIILALKVISYLRIRDYNLVITKYTQSNNYALRNEAITALIRLTDKDNLGLLLNHSKHLSLLDINVIVNAVLKNFKMDVNYLSLLKSSNHNIILIGILLIKHREKIEYLNILEAMLGHSNDSLNYEIWDTCLTLSEDKNKCIDKVIEYFSHQNEEIKLLILSQDFNIEQEKYDEFICKIIEEDGSLVIKTKAMNLLFLQNFDMVSRFVNTSDIKIYKAYKEAIDFNLN